MATERIKALACKNCGKEFALSASKCTECKGELIPLVVEDELIGTTFADKYQILSILGTGGMSRVYKAKHSYMKRFVAVKLLHESATSDTVAKARFQLEAEAASALSHPNVITVHDYGLTPQGQAYFIMDCLEGTSLESILEEKKTLPLQEAVEIFTQALEGLDHAHRKGIIHRDIKPSNLVILDQEDGTQLVKLVDFGIAKLVIPNEAEAKQQRLTQTGEIFGTPPYMSPEQCSGRKLDARSDIYSFGCLMYETLAGDPPLIGDTFVSTAVKHVSEIPKPLSEKAATAIPSALDSVIMKCLEKDPNHRFASAAELKQALFDAAYVSGLKGLRVGAIPEPKKPTTSGSGNAEQVARAAERKKNAQQMKLILTVALALGIAGSLYWGLFLYSGPASDAGPTFYKFYWQQLQQNADNLLKEKKYIQAAAALETCEEIARKYFNDDKRRLEATLQKQVEAYGGAHRPDKIEEANSELVQMASDKVFAEFDKLMLLLKEWQTPTKSNVRMQERAQNAAAYADRITACADKLSVRSRTKQECLLKTAAEAYDKLNLKDGVFRAGFRIQLAEVYRAQQRIDEQLAVLNEAVEHAPENPQSIQGWRLKIRANYQLGILNYNNNNIKAAKEQLDSALAWTRKHAAGDKELLQDCLNAEAQLYRWLKDKDSLAKAKAFADEAISIGKEEEIKDGHEALKPGVNGKTAQ